ncbi:MAG: Asp-tRNA(Asn)/Glu-tRNA(Gln) amidotransferase subunit GatA [Gemmatimonadetes bacterium]|nr:Asp-tRNA(Asn)/Glu-tRNA(Gln) amidotransferase subunit GatA [Gemmatimonadota bacterium]
MARRILRRAPAPGRARGGRSVSLLDVARGAIARIREREAGPEALNAFLSVADPASLTVDAPTGPLAGVPIAVKDILATTDLPTTCGSRVLEGYRSPFEATAVRRARAAGAVVVGKTNMDEFAMGSSTENSAYGPTLNPHDRTRVPGGSSGGSAAAVAAGYVTMALGSDTGGSVRQPAAFCGVVGIKPTYGRVSRYGLVAYASSLDQVGTFGRTVTDAARLLQAVAGHDERDATSVDRPVPDYEKAVRRGVAGLVVGVPAEYDPDELDPEIRRLVNRALETLRACGAEVRRVSLPHTRYAIPTYYVIATAEASSNLSRYDGVRYGVRRGEGDLVSMYEGTRSRGLGAEVKRRIMLGTYALSAGYYDEYYGTAQRARLHIIDDFRRVFYGGADVLFTPTSPTPAFKLGERTSDPVQMYLSDVFTVTANLAGIPGLSLPIGRVGGLPVGGQVLAPWWDEERMLGVAGAIEESLGGSAR